MKFLLFIWTGILFANPFTIASTQPKYLSAECLMQNAFLEGESTRLHIPGFADAYNPTIVKNKEGYTLFFRDDEYKKHKFLKKTFNYMTYLWMVDLDPEFNIISHPKVVSLRSPYCEDPRVVAFKDKWILFFNEALPENIHGRNMRMAVISPETRQVERVYTLPGARTTCEKNWTPFVFEDRLFFVYDFKDVSIYEIHFQQKKITAELVAIQDSLLEPFRRWIEQYGPIRGGAPLFEVDGKMWSFFHSYFSEKTYDEKVFFNKHYYHPGLLTFDFKENRVLQMLPYPLLHAGAYGSEKVRCFNKSIVYPSGAVYLPDEESFVLTIGENDSAILLVKYKKEWLEQVLTNVEANS